MYLFNDDIRTVLWFAVVRRIAVAVLVFGVKEPSGRPRAKAQTPLQASEIGALGAGLLAGGGGRRRFSPWRGSREAFLVHLRPWDGGLALAWARAVIAVMSLVYCGKRLSGGAAPGQRWYKGRYCCWAYAR